jgi:hypothetical protein
LKFAIRLASPAWAGTAGMSHCRELCREQSNYGRDLEKALRKLERNAELKDRPFSTAGGSAVAGKSTLTLKTTLETAAPSFL